MKANQDRAVIVSPFHKEGDWLLGLFDGHGSLGHCVAELASQKLPKLLLERISASTTSAEISSILFQTFVDLHVQSIVPVAMLKEAGTTAISMLKLGNTLYISNLGDSVAFVVKYDETNIQTSLTVVYQTKPHKPDDPLERRRIEAAGGHVLNAPFRGVSSRLLIPLADGMEVGLAMSRSLGDAEGDRVGHSAEPTTDILPLQTLINTANNPNIKCLCLCASDGLLDKVSPLQVAHHVATSFLPHDPLLPLEAAEQLLLRASNGWLYELMGGGYRDDMTIAVHKLELELELS